MRNFVMMRLRTLVLLLVWRGAISNEHDGNLKANQEREWQELPEDDGFLDAPETLPNTSIVLSARATAASNRARLRSLLNRLKHGEEAELCAGPFPSERSQRLVRWFHVPKCGSTFFNTLFRHGCIAERPDIYLGSRTPRDLFIGVKKGTIGVPEMAEVVLRRQCDGGEHRFLNGSADIATMLKHWATHQPLRNPAHDRHVVVLVREPHQRILSAYNFGKHIWGSEMRGKGIGSAHFAHWRSSVVQNAHTARDYAATPGVAGCLAKMIQGCYCATRPKPSNPPGAPYTAPITVACPYRWRTVDDTFVQGAAARLTNFGFVGLQDAYNASVCLFHHMYGLAPQPHEFFVFNMGWQTRKPGDSNRQAASIRANKYKLAPAGLSHPGQWDEAPLGDFVDVIDNVVYAAALGRFETDLDAALHRIRLHKEST